MYVRGLGTILVPNPLFLYVHDKGQIRNIMKRNISNTILTKDYIFSKVSQITILVLILELVLKIYNIV